MAFIVRKSVLIFILVLLPACSGTEIAGSYSNPEFKGRIDRIYLVGIARDEMNRRVFEDAFSNQLFSMGVSSESSYRDIMTSDEVDSETLARKMAEKNCDSVLLTRLIGQRKETVVNPGGFSGYNSYGGHYARPSHYNSWGNYYGRRPDLYYTPPSTNEFIILTVESVLYDLRTEELIWSAQLETVVEESLHKMMQDYVELVAKDLEGKGLI